MRRLLIAVLVVSLFYYGALIYPVLRIIDLVWPDLSLGTWQLLAIAVLPVLLRMPYERWPNATTRTLAAVSLTWLGCYFMAFLPVLAFELINLIVPLPSAPAGIGLAASVAGLCVYGFANAQRLSVNELRLRGRSGVPTTRIAQISDVHVGSRRSRFLDRVVARVNAARPDMVMITGDLIDFRGIQESELRALAELEAPAWFCTGNHERYVDLEEICQRLKNLGIHVLRNESVVHGAFQITGVDDADSRQQLPEHLQQLTADPQRYRILLYHRPDGVREAADWGADLMLVGHTHAGQIFPFNYLVRRVFPRLRGRYDVKDMVLNVSTGTGTWGPVLRLGSRCEIGMMILEGGEP